MKNSRQLLTDKDAKKEGRISLISTLGIGLSVIIILLIFVELLARSARIQTILPVRSVGNSHAQFEIKWFKLEEYVRQNGGVDVILLGNSMLNTGVDPEVFVEEYEKTTGVHLRVFNFGVEGLTVSPNSKLASLLIETYHPGTLIYFTEIRDYIAKNGVNEEATFLDSDWLAYRLGVNNPKGWLIDHSRMVQYWLPFRGWSRPDFLDNYILSTRRLRNTSSSGYEFEDNVRQVLLMHPDPDSADEAELFELYGNFSFDPQRLEELKSILSLEESGTRIVISEIPVDPAFYEYFGGETVHQAYYSEIMQYVSDQGGTFAQMINPHKIPYTGRSDDYVHMNILGAKIYSRLLAQEFAALCPEQGVCLEPVNP